MKKIKIAIAGVGNCASSLIQGISFYSKKPPEEWIGLMHPEIGGYKPEDIEVVAAFDVDMRKVGKPLTEAIFAPPNCTKIFQKEIFNPPVEVKMGPVLDGVSHVMKEQKEKHAFRPANLPPCDVVAELKRGGAEMLMIYLPVGSGQAAQFYAEACLEAGIGMINNIPVFIASEYAWSQRFAEKNLPIIGDDIKSQLGATIIHRVLAKLFIDRGIKLDSTYQLNFAGNTDFLNMLDRQRLEMKKISKTEAVQSQLDVPLDEDDIHIGPSDYIPWLKDNKNCLLRIEGRGFGDVPMHLELKLSVEDSPNSAGVGIDAIRCLKLALDRGVGGVITSPSAYFMKHPPVQLHDEKAHRCVEEFIAGQRER